MTVTILALGVAVFYKVQIFIPGAFPPEEPAF